MKRSIVSAIKQLAMKAACKSVGKSVPLGIYEIEPPQELKTQRRQQSK